MSLAIEPKPFALDILNKDIFVQDIFIQDMVVQDKVLQWPMWVT